MNQSHFHSSSAFGKRRGFSSFLGFGSRGLFGPVPAAGVDDGHTRMQPRSMVAYDRPSYASTMSSSSSSSSHTAPAAAAATAAAATATMPAESPSHRAHKPIDETTWTYIARVPFARLARGQKQPAVAPLGELVAAIQTDAYLLSTHGPEAIAALLRPVASPLLHLAPSQSGSSFAGGRALVWVSFREFRERCTGTKSYTNGTSSSKRKRPAPSSILQRLSDRREDFFQLLKQRSSDYNAETEAKAQAKEEAEGKEAVAAANARVDGVLAGLGGEGDELTRLMAEMEAQLKARAQERRKVALGREAAVAARMEGDPMEALARKRLAPLSAAEKAEVARILDQGRELDIVVKAFNVDMLRQHLRTCRPGTWLNDEVINFWMNLLDERDKALCAQAAAEGQTRRRCWFFNSFFLAKLLRDDPPYKYQNVRRWSRRAGDLFQYDKVFFPVNIDNTHWCLAVVHMQEKKIQYLDSMCGTGKMYLDGLKKYLADEHQDKKKAPLDMSDWELVQSNPTVTPQQGNGSDCGCFASAFAYLMSEGIPFKHVSQKDMASFRQRLVLSIVRKALTWENGSQTE